MSKDKKPKKCKNCGNYNNYYADTCWNCQGTEFEEE